MEFRNLLSKSQIKDELSDKVKKSALVFLCRVLLQLTVFITVVTFSTLRRSLCYASWLPITNNCEAVFLVVTAIYLLSNFCPFNSNQHHLLNMMIK